MRILVVDDENLLVKGIKFNLENDGYEVVTGSDGMEAVEKASNHDIDLIVLDLMMPRLDGLEACRKIREFSDVPIIMLTAKADDMDKLMGFEHVADDYLTKPFNILELKARIRALLRRAGSNRKQEPENRIECGHIALDRDVTVRENIRYHAILHRISRKDTDERIERLSEMMGLGPYMDTYVLNLSGGWKRRVAIVCAIIHEPEILFLDEPTAGLDTQSRHMLWKLIRELNRKGTTIFLTTHYMDEAESLCDRVAIIDHGRSVRMGTPIELCESIGKWAVEYVGDDGDKVFRYFSDWEESRAFMDSLPRDMPTASRATNLEDVFLELTGRDTTATQEVRFRI